MKYTNKDLFNGFILVCDKNESYILTDVTSETCTLNRIEKEDIDEEYDLLIILQELNNGHWTQGKNTYEIY